MRWPWLAIVLFASSCARDAAPPAPKPKPAQAAPAAEAARPLLRRHPALARALPWVELADLPTPVQSHPRLAARVGARELWVKRDDRTSPAYGGNKVRKLELFLGEARRLGRSRIVTFGGVGSNHALATAVHARRLGLSTTLLLLPQQPSAHVRSNLLAMAETGAELFLARSLDESVAARPHVDESTYVIPTGGTAPLGDVGLVNAGFELAEQVARGELPEPDEVWVAFGTGGTAAGLALGFAAAGLRSRVMAVRVSSPRYATWKNLVHAFDATRDFLRERDPSFPRVRLGPERAEIVEGFAGKGYGIPSRAGRDASELARELASLELDDTYTAKTLAALAARAPNGIVLFWNTFDPRPHGAGADPARLPAELRGFAK